MPPFHSPHDELLAPLALCEHNICPIIMAGTLILQLCSASGQHLEMCGMNSLQQYQVLAVNSTES